MRPIKIMTTSLADIPHKLIDQYDIDVLPLTIRIGDEEYKDGVDITSHEVFKKMKEMNIVPTSSQVPPNVFMEEMKKWVEKGYEVIVINGSSRVSGTHQSALMAQRELNSEYISVIDTLALSYGCGIIVVEAAKMAQQGKNKEEILNQVDHMIEKVDHLFSVPTLEYLKKGGRISTTKAAIGTLLNVKPILTIEDGKVVSIDKVRGNKKMIAKLIDLAKDRGIKEGQECMYIGHGGDEQGLEKLKKAVIESFHPNKIESFEIGPTIGSYTGPGLLAILCI